MKKKIFLDLDGVFASFHEGVIEHTGKDISHFKGNDNLLWDSLRQIDNLFYTLPVLEGSQEMLDYLLSHDHDYEFLTAIPRPEGKLATAADDKERWVRAHLTKTVPVSTVVGGKNKWKFLIKHPGAVLIDDYQRNLDLWAQNGGISVLHTSPKNTVKTLQSLNLGFK